MHLTAAGLSPRGIVLLAMATLIAAGPWAMGQAPHTQSANKTGNEQLRQRIDELEAQNAAILKQLAAIQARLDGVAAATAHSRTMEVASLTPIVPKPPGAMPAVQAAPSVPAPQQLPVRTEGNRSEIGFYGFVRVDAIFDDSRINAFQTPTFVRSEPEGAKNRSNFTFHPRLTRIGMNYKAPAAVASLAGAQLTGKIEFDFQNGGRESRAVPRYRHAYMQLAWGRHSLLMGQTWDLISPLYPTVNADTLMWNAGNLGDRRVQFRYSYAPSEGFTLQTALGLTGAVDSQDVDGNGILDGEASTMPNFQGRVGYNGAGNRLHLGAWGHYARQHTDVLYGSKDDFDSYSYGADYELRFAPNVNLRGEIWAGSNLSDFRGGIGQSFLTATGKEVDSRGGWVELGLRGGPYGFSTGYTMDSPKNGHVASGGPTENRAWYITNQIRLAPQITFGLDYLFWKTHFKGLRDGTDNRVNAYMIYGF